MSGKWPIFGVLGLGLIASICAAVLMAAMRAGGEPGPTEPVEVAVVVAGADLPPMSRLEKSSVEISMVPAGSRPEGGFSDPVEILGRVVKTPLVAGQAVTAASLMEDSAAAQLASSLPSGSRAVSVELPGTSAMRGLLYPGCRVDVIVSYRTVPGRVMNQESSRTLLQNVGVLAVDEKTLFTPEPEEDDEEAAPVRRTGKGFMVTLLVDPQQARELQAARDSGTISLSLRNPEDASLTDDPMAAAETEAEASPRPGAPVRLTGPWRTLVIRGDSTEVKTFDLSKTGGGWAGPPSEQYADAPTEAPVEIDE